jgi:cobalt/nickel transport system permease protein
VHIPDGFLDAKTAVATSVLATAGLGLALAGVRRTVPPRRVPLIGLAAAFVFAAQMLNFPVVGGTSGHLIGAVLAAVLLGPSAAVLVMSAVLILQCLMFADGGVTALGANLFNMALVAPLVGYSVYRVLWRVVGEGLRGRLFSTAFAAWCSTVAAAVSCAGQLALSGTVPLRVALPAMGGIHLLIGLGEALITTLVVAAVARARPELLLGPAGPRPRPRYGELAGWGVLVALGLAFFVAPFASGWPDGLERVAATLGFEHRAAAGAMHGAPLPDYRFPGLSSTARSTGLAGVAGTLIAFGLAWLLATSLTPHRSARAHPGGKGEAPDAPRAA